MTKLLAEIQQDLVSNNLDAFILAKSDPFLCGYYTPYKDRLKDVSNFSGSSGVVVITQNDAYLFVDSRYTEQAKKESAFTVFEVPRDTKLPLWLGENLKGKKVVFDGKIHSYEWHKQLKEQLLKEGIDLLPIDDLLMVKWFGVTSFKQEVFDYPLLYAGEESSSKIQRVADFVNEKELDALIVLAPENTSWLLNKRAKEKTEYPVVYQRMLLKKDASYVLFDEDIDGILGLKIGLDFKKVTTYLMDLLIKRGAQLIDVPEIVDEFKAVKNEIELKNIKDACLFESAVICKFLAYVEQNKLSLTEFDCDEKLKELRSQSEIYFHDSFQTIAASGSHAAMPHYFASKERAILIKENPLLLVDTGGHYLNGTTDMTRTIVISTPTKMMKQRYTEVLKGHIALAKTSLNKGETTAILDEKAHFYLRESGVDFYHATGHGIGLMLGVHEAPPTIYCADENGLKEGMVFSNEPAYYSMEDGFGIRLENMLYAKYVDDKIELENLLFIPFDYRAIDFDLLSNEEKAWLREYHQKVVEKVFVFLSEEEKEILSPFVEVFLKG